MEKKNPFTCSALFKMFTRGQKWLQNKAANENSIFYYLWESSVVVLLDRKSECMYEQQLTNLLCGGVYYISPVPGIGLGRCSKDSSMQ